MKVHVQYTVELDDLHIAALNSLYPEEMNREDIKNYLRDEGLGGLEEITNNFYWTKKEDQDRAGWSLN